MFLNSWSGKLSYVSRPMGSTQEHILTVLKWIGIAVLMLVCPLLALAIVFCLAPFGVLIEILTLHLFETQRFLYIGLTSFVVFYALAFLISSRMTNQRRRKRFLSDWLATVLNLGFLLALGGYIVGMFD